MDDFIDIAQETIAKAERVKCSLEDFYYGLQQIIAELQDRINCAGSDGVDL